ncbi:MAG: AhpC/TSA family protein [Prevotellaceae bacterium]|jgi:peroxiredoxin|nr:AhpC/TSA family protein [Prevotellaceae bacterium]
MKKILLFAFIAIAALACSEKKSYTINGNVEQEDLNGQTVYLKKQSDNKLVSIDSTQIADNKFSFTGNVKSTEVYVIVLANKQRVVVVDNVPIDITVGEKEINVSGTELNDVVTQFMKQRNVITEKVNDIYVRYDQAKQDGTLNQEFEDSLDAEYDEIEKEYNDLGIAFLKENINNKAGEYFIERIVAQMEVEKIEEILSDATEETLNNETFKKITERVKAAKTVAVGQPFVDIEMPSPQGETIKLSDYAGKGKYVLIDFWAAWCGPCRNEMPTLVEVYAQYKDKNFEIVGVSFDKDKESWLKGIEELGITWVQMSDVKYWQSEGAKLYNVRSIPHTVLIDPQGIIIEKNLRGQALKDKLAELIK